jgi:hypothetical protein
MAENKKTKLSVRIRGKENYYLNMVENTKIEVVAPNGFILGSLVCLSQGVIAFKMNDDNDGWTLQGSRTNGRGHIEKGVTLGTTTVDKFILEDEKKEVA